MQNSKYIYTLYANLFVLIAFGQMSNHDVYTLGNLCDITEVESIINSLETEIKLSGNGCTILLNGDLTSAPVNTEQGKSQLERLDKLIWNFGNRAGIKVIMIFGDRDWNDNKPKGYKAVLKLEKEIEEIIEKGKLTNVVLVTEKGCPGPFEVKINPYTTMIALNSQWWNHKFQKPIPSDALCKFITDEDIAEEIDDIIGENENKNILIAAHHPIRSLGNYGGRFSFVDNLLPFPIVGSFINGYKANVGGIYDLNNERLQKYTYMLYNELYFHSNVIFASGHEKNHQIQKEVDNILINSGSLKEGKYSPSDYSTILQDNAAGFIKIEYKASGAVNSKFIGLNKGNKENLLFNSACTPGAEDGQVDQNASYIPCSTNDDLQDQDIITEYATIKPGEGYEYNWFTKLWLGEHHRPTWITPVTVPYLRITEDYNNLSPLKVGGGRQTLSLKFLNEEGKRLTFRSVDKEPRKALNYELRQSIVGKLFEDQTSAQHPFGALPAASMLDHLDILHANPKLYVLPDTDALGGFQGMYGGMLGMLEENPGKKDKNGAYFANADDILQSRKLFRELYDDKKNKIAADEFLRARLFDILIGDWSKHENNWKWAEYEQEDSSLFRPIPRDRDHVFSKWDGILPWIADREWLLPNTEGFDYEIDGFQSAVFQARSLDRCVLTEACKEMYTEQAFYIQRELTDERIRAAVLSIPKESFEIEGEVIIAKLIKRRADLQKYASSYFEWINKDVVILGSAKDDVFEVYNHGDTLFVDIYEEKKGRKVGKPLISRYLANDVTELVRIYGLGEEDIFNVNIDRDLNMKVVLLGGDQVDQYNISNDGNNTKVIDSKKEVESLAVKTIEIRDNWHKHRYTYDRHAKQFNSYFPLISLGYNNFNGFSLRSSTSWTRHRWDKPDYHMRHSLSLSLSSAGDYGFRYNGDLRHFYGKSDLIWNATFANPDFFDSYYGQGNFSRIDPLLDGENYYISTFNNYRLTTGVRRIFWGESFAQIQTGFDFYVNKEIENTILENEVELLGANEQLGIIPVILNLDIDFRDNGTFPKKGSRLTIDGYAGSITNKDYDLFATIGGTLEQYFSTYNLRPFTLGLKVGGVKGLSEVPFYLQPRLGGNSGLRGYTSNRFFGRSMIYFNSELRWMMFKDDEASIPYEFGVIGFYDIGKVSNNDFDNDVPTRFYSGYGGGVFFVPFDERFTLSVYLAFSEENSFYPRFTIGTTLN